MNSIFLNIITIQKYVRIMLCGMLFYAMSSLTGRQEERQLLDVQKILQQAEVSFNQEHYIQSLAHYMHAKKYAPYAMWHCIDKNIETVYKNIGIPHQVCIQEKIFLLLLKATSFFSLSFFKVIFLFFWYILFVLILFFTYSRMRFIIFLISAVLLFFIALVGFRYYVYSLPYAIVQQSTLKAGPGDYYHDLGSLYAAEKVIIEQQKDDFYLVKNKKVKGWLKKENVYIY